MLLSAGEAEAHESRDSCIGLYSDRVPAATSSSPAAIRAALSEPRFGTYLTATSGDEARAVALYGWNARISAALMLPAHFAEVATRNPAADALEAVYSSRWPWDPPFERSLPSSSGPAYNPRRDLVQTRGHHSTTGKVIAELKFAFWQKMFTARHDPAVWDPHIRSAFPNAPGMTPAQVRRRVYEDLEQIRRMRNRIAHHEPIFTRTHSDDLRRMIELVEMRSPDTARWVRAMEDVSAVIAQRP
jgi:hypothetical protein